MAPPHVGPEESSTADHSSRPVVANKKMTVPKTYVRMMLNIVSKKKTANPRSSEVMIL